MMIDMKFFNVYYFCHLADISMGNPNFATNNAEFIEETIECSDKENFEDFPKISILRTYCGWLIKRVFIEQASLMSSENAAYDFNPFLWINEAIQIYRGVKVDPFIIPDEHDDYLDLFWQYVEILNNQLKYFDIEDVLDEIAREVESILFQNRDFLLRFNDQVSIAFTENKYIRKRTHIPEWVKRSVIFRDNGQCVFCKKDLTGICSLLENNERHFDHIVPLKRGGINDVCNIQLSCRECNLKKSTQGYTSTVYQSAY